MKITTVGVCIICGIFPLLILPQLPGTVTLAFLTLFACVLAFIPVKTVRYIVLTLLFFVWGILAAKQILWAGETLTGATQDAIVEIIATDGMTTHYGQITHLQGRRIFPPRRACCFSQPCVRSRDVWRISSASGLCRTSMVNETQSSCSSWST